MSKETAMRIDSLRLRLAAHEARHAAFGASRGLGITEVHVGRTEGHVAWDHDFPNAETLAGAWQRDPVSTTDWVRAGVVAMVAPHDGAKFPGPCHDASLVGTLGRVWQRLPSSHGMKPVSWQWLCAEARAAVRLWQQRPGAAVALDYLARCLAEAGTLDGPGWENLWTQDFTRPLRRPMRPTSPRPVAPASAEPDYPLSVWDTWWFQKNSRRKALQQAGRANDNLWPVPSDWREVWATVQPFSLLHA